MMRLYLLISLIKPSTASVPSEAGSPASASRSFGAS